MDRTTALERFRKLEDARDGQWMWLSKDYVLGFVKEPEWEKYISLGQFRVKERKKTHLKVLDLCIDTRLLFRAMAVFRRRYKFEIGFYVMNKWIPCVRDGENIILIAPILPYDKNAMPLEDFVVNMSEEKKRELQDILQWKTVLHGREKEWI